VAARNDALRAAIAAAGWSIDDVAARLDVDAKTVQRWVSQGRHPHRRTREQLARLLQVPSNELWDTDDPIPARRPSAPLTWPTRAEVPNALWSELLDGATERVDICAYSVMWLIETVPGLVGKLGAARRRGARVRIALAAPDGQHTLARGEAEGIGTGLQDLARISWTLLAPAAEDLDLRQHDLEVPASLFRFDDELLWNPYWAGVGEREAPVTRLNLADTSPGNGGMAAAAAKSFDWIWEHSLPHSG
jgi:hypothetical protein